MKQKTKQLIMTLVALLALTTQAWAADPYEEFTTADRNKTQLVFTGEHFKITGTKIDDWGMYVQSDCPVTISALNGETITKVEMTIYYLYSWDATHTIVSTPDATIDGTYSSGQTFTITPTGANASEVTLSANVDHDNAQLQVIEWKVYYVAASAGTPVPLTWTEATKTATLTNGMPAGNVTVSVEYFPQAEFATRAGETPELLAPTAIANVPANTDDPIVTAGTVANIGTSDNKQGTLMYFVSQPTDNTVPDAPTYDTEGWTDKVPTADGLAEGKAFVWYYIKGAEPDNIADRTDDNTRSDSDIMPLGTSGYVTLEAEPTYDVTLNAEGLSTEEAAAWKVAKGTDDPAAFPLKGVKKSETVTVTYSGTKKIIGVKAEKPVTLATPLTIEAVTPGTIVVNMTGTLTSGMKYSVNGGTTKTLITESRDIPVAKGDKVQFYGNGTQTQAYYIQNGVRVSINGSGDGFQTKVYGNIMSLLDETGFATKTDLPNEPLVFSGLFAGNTTLIDASELLLPATTLAAACYESMFHNCTSLTTAPKLPATTLATQCYTGMFYRCTSLTSAYVKAAYTEERFSCRKMFDDCTATGAVLHTTSDNKASWENMMGSGKTWENWTVADDWQE